MFYTIILRPQLFTTAFIFIAAKRGLHQVPGSRLFINGNWQFYTKYLIHNY